ncbi:MAG: hypothetical protein M1G31_06505 [Pseudanabaena sp. Salubria-1]|nr:hypothetical protein [Pseudanabaena sp. Salubria-1]
MPVRPAHSTSGFGNSAVTLQPRGLRHTWPEEIAMALFFVFSLYAYRGLYDQIPFLLALGLSSITAYLLITGLKLMSGSSAKLQRLQPAKKLLPAGLFYLVCLVTLIAFIGHIVRSFNFTRIRPMALWPK